MVERTSVSSQNERRDSNFRKNVMERDEMEKEIEGKMFRYPQCVLVERLSEVSPDVSPTYYVSGCHAIHLIPHAKASHVSEQHE